MAVNDSPEIADELIVDYPTGAIALITFNRPRVLNALTHTMLTQLSAHIEQIGRQSTLRAIVLTGAGRAFSAGGDVRALGGMDDAGCREYLASYTRVHKAIIACHVPVIAALNGYTFGGGFEIACMADTRVVDPAAVLCVADAAIGMVPTGGLTWLLPRLVGHGRARTWTLWNSRLSAADATGAGLCEFESEPGASVDHAIALGMQLAALPRHGLTAIRRTFATASDLDRASEAEVDSNLGCLEHPETQRALSEFLAR